MSKNAPIAYRPDIDGLRAVAVVLVLLFHASPKKYPYGFIGVDIFFVISGYLITSIILKEIEQGTFTIGHFYIKRIKRIFPGLLTMMLVTLGLGVWILNSEELKNLLLHIFSGAFFVSNFTLWSESGYFDTSSDFKPLLHLWSLSIEEQFYLFWPLLLIWGTKRKWNLLRLTLGIVVSSFLLNIVLIQHDPSTTFYLLPTRAWELLIGSVLAILASAGRLRFKNYEHTTSALGFILLVGACLFIKKDTVFPGYWALLPVLGTFFIIASGPGAFFNKNILSRKWIVGIGLISYPLYLWHWPLLAYLRVIEFGEAPGVWRNSSLAVSFFLAALTYFFIEKRVRLRVTKENEKSFALSTTFVLGSLGVVALILSQLLSYRSSNLSDYAAFEVPETKNGACERMFPDYQGEFCLLSHDKEPEVALIGDSHALALYQGMEDAFPGQTIVLLGHSACAPFLDTVSFPERGANRCLREMNQALAILRSPKIKKVFFHFRANTYEGDIGESFTKTIASFKGLGKDLFFIHQFPELGFEPQTCADLRPMKLTPVNKDCRVSKNEVDKSQVHYREMLKGLEILQIDPLKTFCDNEYCYGKRDRRILYRDHHHLNAYGSKYFWKTFN